MRIVPENTANTLAQWVGDSAPQDVKNGAPAPSTWDKPALYLPNDQCNIGSHFYDLQLVL